MHPSLWRSSEGGFEQNPGFNPRLSEEKGLSPAFSGFPRCSSGSLRKGEKSRKRAEKAGKGRLPGKGDQTPLKPHLLHTPIDGSPTSASGPGALKSLEEFW